MYVSLKPQDIYRVRQSEKMVLAVEDRTKMNPWVEANPSDL